MLVFLRDIGPDGCDYARNNQTLVASEDRKLVRFGGIHPHCLQLDLHDARDVVRSATRLRDIAALEDRNMRRHTDPIRRWVADASNLLERIYSLGPKVTTNV